MKSMTAFARTEEQGEWGSAVWELRTVNHRYLEMNVRLPDAFRFLEMPVRELLRTHLQRGKLEAILVFAPGALGAHTLHLNHALLSQLSMAIDEVRQTISVNDHVSALDVLNWPGVLHTSAAEQDALAERLLALLKIALTELLSARAREGERLHSVMQAALQAMQTQVALATTRIPIVLKEQQEKLVKRLDELKLSVDPARLEQEMALWIQRLDISEELQRLQSHITEVKSILQQTVPMGRRLDFLLQELNREANTLGAKSADLATTRASVELKVLIEQVREQVQNLE